MSSDHNKCLIFSRLVSSTSRDICSLTKPSYSLFFVFLLFRYCNSHLQVLGIVPKKSRKKKSNDQNETNAQPTSKTTHTEIISCRTSQNCVVRRAERTVAVTGTSKPSPDERSLRKAKILSANPLLCELVDTYSRANSHRQDLLSYYGELLNICLSISLKFCPNILARKNFCRTCMLVGAT